MLQIVRRASTVYVIDPSNHAAVIGMMRKGVWDERAAKGLVLAGRLGFCCHNDVEEECLRIIIVLFLLDPIFLTSLETHSVLCVSSIL